MAPELTVADFSVGFRPSRKHAVSETTSVPPDLFRLGQTPPLHRYLRGLWERRDFAMAVAQGEMRAQHLDTLLGNLWHLLNPLLLIGVYYLIFGVVLGTSRGVENFIAFLAIGVLVYNFSQRAVMQCAATIVNNEGLIRSLQFPRALLPISSILRQTYTFASAAVVILLTALLTGEPLSLVWLLVIPVIALQVVFNLGIGFFFARFADKVRDILNVIPYIFRIFFYASGVLFSVDVFLPDLSERFPAVPVHELFVANPFYVYISLPREYLMATESHQFVTEMWYSAIAWAVVALVAGLLFFRAGEKEYGRG